MQAVLFVIGFPVFIIGFGVWFVMSAGEEIFGGPDAGSRRIVAISFAVGWIGFFAIVLGLILEASHR